MTSLFLTKKTPYIFGGVFFVSNYKFGDWIDFPVKWGCHLSSRLDSSCSIIFRIKSATDNLSSDAIFSIRASSSSYILILSRFSRLGSRINQFCKSIIFIVPKWLHKCSPICATKETGTILCHPIWAVDILGAYERKSKCDVHRFTIQE